MQQVKQVCEVTFSLRCRSKPIAILRSTGFKGR
jgi:hypothetical protein